MPMNRLLASDSTSRLRTRYTAKNTSSMILANSPGWMLKPPTLIHSLAPLISESDAGSTTGIITSTMPARPSV